MGKEKEPKSGETESAEIKKKEVFGKLRDEMDKMTTEFVKGYSPESSEQILREKFKTYINSLPAEEIEILSTEAEKEIPKSKDLADKLSKIFPHISIKDKEAAVKFINDLLADAKQVLADRKKEAGERIKKEGQKKKEAAGKDDPEAEKAAEEAAKAAEAAEESDENKEKEHPSLKEIKAAFLKIWKDEKLRKAYDEFMGDKKLDALLKTIPDENDKRVVKWAVENDVTEDEIKELQIEYETFISQGNSELVGKKVVEWIKDPEKGFNFREGKVLAEIIRRTEESAEKESEKQSTVPEEAKKAGWLGAISMLADKIMELLKKIPELFAGFFKKWFPEEEKKETASAYSPLGAENGAQKNFILSHDYEAGKGVGIKTESSGKVFAIASGSVETDPNAKTITITDEQNGKKVVYKGVTPAAGVSDKIEAGQELASAEGSEITLQVFEKKGETFEEINPEVALGSFIGTEETPPEETPSEPQQVAETQPPAETQPTSWWNEFKKANTIAGPTTAAVAKASAAATPEPKPSEAKQEKPKTRAELEEEVADRLNRELGRKFHGESLDPHETRISFDYPYIEKNEIRKTSCAIYNDKLRIGNTIYDITLTAGATLTGIAIQGPIETGTVTIKGVAPLLGEQEKTIPLKQLLGSAGHVEKLRQGPSKYEVETGSATITFTKQTA